MRWNVVIFSLCTALLCGPVAEAQTGADTARVSGRYSRLAERRTERWRKVIPYHYKVQFAGSIGVASIGPGWTYGRKKQWETDLMLGFLPKFESDRAKAVLTLKESYVPWLLRIRDSKWLVQPLSCSLYFSSILDGDFWVREPGRYPKGYYGFSTRIRANLSLGQRVMFDIPDSSPVFLRDISLYYEFGACDTDFCTFFGDRCIRFKDILSLSVGLKLHI